MTHTPPAVHDLPARRMLAIDGHGPTEAPPFGRAVQALFAVRAALGGDDVPLEGTYRQAGSDTFNLSDPAGWHWTLSVPLPGTPTDADAHASADAHADSDANVGAETHPEADAEAVRAAAAQVGAADVRLAEAPATRAVQTLYRGPYADESAALAALATAAREHGLTIAGPHTEVYLNDPGTTEPGELRTLLRYPVR